MTETIEFEVSDDTVALEVAYGIIGRAQNIHNSPNDDYEGVAIELRDVGQELLEEYE